MDQGLTGVKPPADAERPIYEVAFQGKTQRLAISVGDNGYVIGANPV
ncbi:hypothetical protein ACIRVK_20285 [Streptomyces sp. NPDC101152]